MPELYRVDADWQDWLSEIWDEVDSIASESRLRQAVVRATNDTLTHMRSFLSKGIRATYYVKKADIDAAMQIVKARQRGRNIEGRLSFRYRQSLPLSQFGARQGKTYVSVKVLKANRARRIQPGGEKQNPGHEKGPGRGVDCQGACAGSRGRPGKTAAPVRPQLHGLFPLSGERGEYRSRRERMDAQTPAPSCAASAGGLNA